ncbi:MAG: bifunctional glutamate N-acetyltransferase/amino-acid acetyltransferase ArgJ [Gammaproteobacteria bacterium]|nr:bifunctional glutamate N-acetyltransferase/amino-acid acetyltransferase ArgJ [Gammaproteobacteria bacterium]
MSVGLSEPAKLIPVKGVKLAVGHAGIKKNSVKNDLVLFELCEQATVAAVFTTNKFCAAPVIIARRHLEKNNSVRYLLVNSGNANAGTGEQGLQSALSTCQAVASEANMAETSVLPFSTGVIGAQLPHKKINVVIPSLFQQLKEDNWLAAAKGIMTTDTMPKAVSRRLTLDGKVVTITGICKGSGMIKPDMATMLGYVATDAVISSQELSVCLKQAADASFNCITVDGDTSTNDACILIATGNSGVQVDQSNTEFMQTLFDVFQQLAQSIIRDGEGATKFVTIQVDQAASLTDARELAYTIAHSPLVKTALFASDANWGRILAAIGRAPISSLEIDRVDLFLGDVCLIQKGLPHPEYTEQKGQSVMQEQDITIRVNLNLGSASTTIWTTDLSYDYVKINAEYRS